MCRARCRRKARCRRSRRVIIYFRCENERRGKQRKGKGRRGKEEEEKPALSRSSLACPYERLLAGIRLVYLWHHCWQNQSVISTSTLRQEKWSLHLCQVVCSTITHRTVSGVSRRSPAGRIEFYDPTTLGHRFSLNSPSKRILGHRVPPLLWIQSRRGFCLSV